MVQSFTSGPVSPPQSAVSPESPPASSSGGGFCISALGFYPNPLDLIPCPPGFHKGGLSEIVSTSKKEITQPTPAAVNPLSPQNNTLITGGGNTDALTQLGKLLGWLQDRNHWKGIGLYALAGVLGLAGLTVFVLGSRQGQTAVRTAAEAA